MRQKTTTTPTKTPSVKEILSTIASIEWEASGNGGEAPVPSPDDLDYSAYWNLPDIEAYPDINTRIQRIHEKWEAEREANPRLKHPLASIIRAWQKDQTIQPITPEHDRKFPLAVLKHPTGNFRDLSFVDIETARLREFATPQRIEQVDSQLRFDFAQQTPSILPDVMPLEVAHPLGLKPTTKKGAVSHVIRIFFEALMALEPREMQADLMFTLGDLISYLYPDGKFHRANQLPYVINALDILHFYATVPFDQGTSQPGYWRPVSVRTRLTADAKNDTKIFLDVKLPPDATQGRLVEKAISRMYGKQSAPKFNAYHVATDIWDKHGTVKGNLVDPTRPKERRDSQNNLLDNTEQQIRTSRGKVITDLYHTEAVRQLDREDNPDAINLYPVFSDEDLILACMPNGYSGNRREILRRAKKHWTVLEQAGIIAIRRERDGWRILPSVRHLKAHRAVREASKKSVY